MATPSTNWYSRYEGYIRGAKPKEQDTPEAQPPSRIGAMQRRLKNSTAMANKFQGRK